MLLLQPSAVVISYSTSIVSLLSKVCVIGLLANASPLIVQLWLKPVEEMVSSSNLIVTSFPLQLIGIAANSALGATPNWSTRNVCENGPEHPLSKSIVTVKTSPVIVPDIV